LFEAILTGVNLTGANLDGASLVGAHMRDANLAWVEGMEPDDS
jgi:uncharacterized protein YjbI with pentapeptide repeats